MMKNLGPWKFKNWNKKEGRNDSAFLKNWSSPTPQKLGALALSIRNFKSFRKELLNKKKSIET